jgi:hypothetical protein
MVDSLTLLRQVALTLLLCCVVAPTGFAVQEGTISGVVLESRQDEDNRNHLLVEVKGDDQAGADRLEIKLKGAGKIEMTPYKLPADWQWKWDGRILSAWGPETRLPVWLRFGVGDSPPPSQGDVVVFLDGKRTYRKKGIPVNPRPKVTVSDRFESIVQLPPRVSPGDVVEFEVLDPAKTPAGGTWTVGGADAVREVDSFRYRLTISESLKIGGRLSLSYTDPYGFDLYKTLEYEDVEIVLPADVEERPEISGVTEMAFPGSRFCAQGYYPTIESRYGLMLDGIPLGKPSASSSHVVIHRIPPKTPPGDKVVSGDPAKGFEGENKHQITVINIKGAIDRNELLKGESTPLSLWVEGTDVPITLELSNKTPQVVSLDGGELQEITTSGGAVNKVQKMVHAVSPGDFKLKYSLTLESCPGIYFESLFDDARNDFESGRSRTYEAMDKLSGGSRDAHDAARQAQDLFTRAREKVDRGIENGDIGPETAKVLRRFISDYEARLKTVLATPLPEKEEMATAPPETPASVPPEEPVVATVTDGWFAPTQGVWQGDDYFEDLPGKRLTKTGPAAWNAELDMVKGRPAVVIGIREKGRRWIRIEGQTNGSKLVPVKFRFKLIQGANEKIVYTEPEAKNHVALDGPAGAMQPFTASLEAHKGLPRFGHFLFDNAGGYVLEAELIRASGEETGLKVLVSGNVVETFGPNVKFIPVFINDPPAPGWLDGFTGRARRMAASSAAGIPVYFPLAPNGLPTSAEPSIQIQVVEPGVLSRLWGALPLTKSTERVKAENSMAVLSQRFETDSALTGGGKVVALLSNEDFDIVRPGGRAEAFAASQKLIVVHFDSSASTVAHELVHTMPYLWSSDQMLRDVKKRYHNNQDQNYGNGLRIIGFRDRRDGVQAIMGPQSFDNWITQGTYWHLLRQFRSRPDPELLLVRGFIARGDGVRVGALSPLYQVMGVADLEAGEAATGQWAIQLLDSAGNRLSHYPFTPRWVVPDLEIERSIVSVSQKIPWRPDVREVVLLGPSGPLDRRIISLNAPSVSFSTPIMGTKVRLRENKLQVSWRGSDADGDPLLYSLLYSPDNGRHWRMVAYEIKDTSFDLQVPGRPERIKIRVIATDGARSRLAEIAVRM